MKKILIVDDDVRLLDTTRKVLEATGEYEVMADDCGRRAVAAATTFKPDLLVLDVMMPGMDGGEVAYAIRKQPTNKNVAILFLTSLIGKGEQTSSGGRSTRDVYLSKPVDPKELCRRVAALLG
jgi:DNA-binding response OmpR family regulator